MNIKFLSNVLCPKCGCPPRYGTGMFKVRISLERTDKPSTFELGKEKRVMLATGNVTKLMCGGGHEWDAVINKVEDYNEV